MDVERINSFTNNRYCVLAMAIASVILSYLFFFLLPSVPPSEVTGICRNLSLSPDFSDTLKWGINIILLFVATVLVCLLDKQFAFVREYTYLYGSFFLIITFLNPAFSSGELHTALTGIVILLAALVLFHGFQQKKRRMFVFTVSLFLSAFSMFDYSCLFFMAVFFFGFFQMGIMSFKGFLAMLIGIITPYWIGWGFGLFSIGDLSLPMLSYSVDKYTSTIRPAELVRILLTVATAVFFIASNILTLISYRRQLRAYNGFFMLLAFASMLMMAFDISNHDTYLLTLNISVAYQAAHFFTIHKYPYRFWLFFLLIAANAACSVFDYIDIF